MSYNVELIPEKLPANDAAAWARIEELRSVYYDDPRERHPKLTELHQLLIGTYPCLCSYSDNDPLMDESPWADGPMINNFASEMGMLAIIFSRVGEVLPFIIRQAHALGITVADGQDGTIHRPL